MKKALDKIIHYVKAIWKGHALLSTVSVALGVVAVTAVLIVQLSGCTEPEATMPIDPPEQSISQSEDANTGQDEAPIVEPDVDEPVEPDLTPEEPPVDTDPDPEPPVNVEPETDPPAEENPPETEPVHTHSYKTTEVASTCWYKGYTLHECSCGDSYKDNYLEKLSHSYTSETVSPTTNSKGYTVHTCTDCGSSYKDNYTDPIPEETEPSFEVEPSVPETPPEPSTDNDTETGSSNGVGTPETEDYGFCPYCGRRIWTSWYPTGCFTFLVDSVCDCGQFVEAGECHHH